MTKTLLVLVENVNDYLPILERAGYRLVLAQTPADRQAAVARLGAEVDAVLTRGPLGFFAEEMDALPNLRIICVLGAGYEAVDVPAATARGIVVTNGAGVNAPTVADHAMSLLLALVRDIPANDASVRRGEWRKRLRPSFAGKRLGLLGLGSIGQAIARRASGFDMQVGYHTRSERTDSAYRYFASALELARESDFLIVATPGGASTQHMVNAAVLDALGRDGFIVNIARASVIDTDALLAALHEGRIAGAALDVFDDEPEVPEALKALDNVVLTSHVAGLSPEASRDTVQRVADNLQAFFSGQPVLTPVHA